MRLLADENIPAPLVERLRGGGHDVLFAGEVMRQATDEAILERAIEEGRVLLTFDGDFGRMIFAEHHPSPPGVIYIRKPPPNLAETIERVTAVLARDAPAIDGYFVSVDRTARFHPLPRSGNIHG